MFTELNDIKEQRMNQKENAFKHELKFKLFLQQSFRVFHTVKHKQFLEHLHVASSYPR